ncbi:hypothetical protein OVA10_12465 [Lelliottia sp. SL45]|uniref:hypothetical protein n=1 Tax=Lelliottia sp. SL45 TaxID=2994665 RepID=UPI00227617AE|nr:hypothetical protein [Lelliottia sp. SL45]MCY1698859.1 hypothetical protein [Lelliottia sp. SL45]
MNESTSTIRVSNHNNWPAVELFECERIFLDLMAKHNVQQIFATTTLIANDKDEPFNAAIGHILDCLGSLPNRPDAAFDSLYRVIDQNLKQYNHTQSSPMCDFVDSLFKSNPHEWSNITNILAEHIPQQTADYIASRILDCHIENNPPHTDRIKKRAIRSLGKLRYKEFYKTYLIENPSIPGTYYNLEYNKRRNAGRLMCLLLRQTTALTKVNTSSSILNLSIQSNLLSPEEKLKSLLELMISTYRHERFHGDVFSPFRSSKASLKTYAHAYYALIVSYIVILGILQLENKGGVTMPSILDITNKCMNNFKSFFDSTLDD